MNAKNRKRLLAGLFLLTMLFTSCNPSSNNPKTENLLPLGQWPAPMAKTGGDQGFYQLQPSPQSGCVVTYIDYETQVMTYLCNRADCTHDNETCTAWFDCLDGAMYVANQQQKLLFMLYPADFGHNLISLWTADLNGENRKKVLDFKTNETLVGEVVTSEDNLYFTVQILDSKNTSTTIELRKMNWETYNVELIKTFDKHFSLEDAFEDNLLFVADTFTEEEDENGQKTEKWVQDFYTYNVTSKELNNHFSFPHYSDSSGMVNYRYCVGGNVYIVEPTENNMSNLIKIDAQTGNQELLTTEIPYYHDLTFMIHQSIDNKLLIRSWNFENPTETTTVPKKLVDLKLAVDCTTGEIHYLTLRSSLFEENDTHVGILAEVGEDYLLVAPKVDVVDVKGALFLKESMALIKKEDFWANNPNYIPIENLTDIL